MRKVRKYQSKKTSANTTPKDTTSYRKKIDPGFYKTPELLGGRSGNIDPEFFIKPERVGGKSGNIDPGFSKNPLIKKKTGGTIKKKK